MQKQRKSDERSTSCVTQSADQMSIGTKLKQLDKTVAHREFSGPPSPSPNHVAGQGPKVRIRVALDIGHYRKRPAKDGKRREVKILVKLLIGRR
jgi:hypothetical protein